MTKHPAPKGTVSDRTPNIHLLAFSYYSQGVFRYGNHVAKFQIAPATDRQRELADQTVPADASPGILREWVRDFFSSQEARFEFRVQLNVDSQAMPIEDASVEWDETRSPYRIVAILSLPAQESFSPARRVYAEDARTQDFLLVNHPTISSGDVHTYRRDQAVLLQTSKAPESVQLAATTALRAGADLTALTGGHVSVREPSAYRDLTSAFFADGRGVWELRVQLATDLETTPVEDASVAWPEDVTPYRTVATLTVEPQDSFSPARRVYADDELSFNPWHCLLEHQPLGSIQRVRRPVYDDSVEFRATTNAAQVDEPDHIEDLPA